jgi:glycosyltransferase involved in cell wall biosynthesis
VGPYTIEIEQFIEQESLKNLIFLAGEVPYEKVASYMQQAHVMVLFSKHENFPCVVVEALCCGLPVVSSDVAGVKEAINESNGILVNSGDEEQLLEEVMKIRDRYADYNTSQISSNAISKFNYQVIGEEFHKLYSTIARVDETIKETV